MRPVIGIIIICLPLSPHLGATAFLSIIMALVVFCVVYENITSLQCGAKFWESWENTGYPDDYKVTDTKC
jgi:hypothetical protein